MITPAKRDVVLQSGAAAQNAGAPISRKEIAAEGERQALRFLEQKGLLLVCANWRSGRFGEIDLIMRDPSGLLIFIEVKTRRQRAQADGFATGIESVNWRKRRKMLIAANSYLARTKCLSLACRMDVVIVSYQQALMQDGRLLLTGLQYLHLPGAFD